MDCGLGDFGPKLTTNFQWGSDQGFEMANQRLEGYFSILDTSLQCEVCVLDHYLAETDNFHPEIAVERKAEDGSGHSTKAFGSHNWGSFFLPSSDVFS